ncbi:DNA (cytosine-5)-methyltransferase 1 [Agrococcus sp. UYP10]|uniref:DNA cytosine methyltransferase n=1 Tax=Agrococcus sp. UYP10 TaxID=1756355 RepID=UPI003399DA93
MVSYAVKLERSAPLVLDPHPSAPSDEGFLAWCNTQRAAGRPLAVDLFSGAGGLGLGIESAGWTVVAAVDNDREALATHRANFPGKALDIDMADPLQVADLVDKLRLLPIDLVAGGPPCQPFSRAGRAKIRSLITEGVRDPVDARMQLWRSFIDVALALRPRAVLMENVPDMAIGDDLVVVREIASLLEDSGYVVDYRLLDAWRHGVPQHRKRFILQARRDGVVPTWPRLDRSGPTVRDAIGDLPPLELTTGSREMHYPGTPEGALARELRGQADSGVVFDHMTRPVREDDREAFAMMTSTTLYSDLPERLKRYRSDTFNDKYKRLDWDQLSRTITAHIAKDGYWYIHPAEHRTLTVREAARIQTFPDGFRFSGTRSDAFRQIGNAVPPILGRAVAQSLACSAAPKIETARLPLMRSRLADWGARARRSEWWLYPGPEMTPAAAAVAALLEVHRLPVALARAMMEPLRGVLKLNPKMLSHIDVQALSATRRHSIRELRALLQGKDEDSWPTEVEKMMGKAQLQNFAVLQGRDELILSKRVASVVAMLMELPDAQTGLYTDIKVALAQLVGRGPHAALRMCAIRTINLSEARAFVKAPESSLQPMEHA